MVLLVTDPSTLSPTGAVPVAEFVYFQQHVEKEWIRIGRTAVKGKREWNQPDFDAIAVIQGCSEDEDALHDYFDSSRVSRPPDRSTYTGDEVHDYVAWLLERSHAGRDRGEAEAMPRLPFSVWSPQSRRNEGRHGELSLFAELHCRERVAMARSDLPWLSTESDDWYTPADIIEAARRAMGAIDTDPATCVAAQRHIRAATWYTKNQDGLRSDLPWRGAVWLNPPYGRGESSAVNFVRRLIDEITDGSVTQAITCLNLASASALWFQPIWQTACRHLIYRGRVNFRPPAGIDAGSSSTKGTIFSYFGGRAGEFAGAFGHMGVVVDVAINSPAEATA